MRIVVVGAGIAGLASALAVADLGEVSVLERRSATEANHGAGIQLSPNAVKALRALGADGPVERAASAPDGLVVRNGARIVTRLPYTGLERRFGAPYLTISRAALHAALSDAVRDRGIVVRYGNAVDTFAIRPSGCRVPSIDGEVDLVVAADGVQSRLRKGLVGDGPIASGWTAWRGRGSVVAGGDGDLVMGGGHHLVRYPLSADDENCVLVTADPTLPEAIARGPTGAYMADVGGWQPWAIRIRKPHVFRHPHVAFVGDAAHASLPFLAQGGAMALEDAATLGAAIRTHGPGERALAAYDAARRDRQARISALGESQGQLYHLGFPLAAGRDLILARLGPDGILRRMAFVWSWTPPS